MTRERMLELIEELIDIGLTCSDDVVYLNLRHRLIDIKAEVGAWPRSASFQTADGWCGCLVKPYQHKVTPQCGARPMPAPEPRRRVRDQEQVLGQPKPGPMRPEDDR